MTFKERAQDLFIPIRRKQRAPSVGSDSTTTSASSTAYSTPSRTSSKTAAGFENSTTPTKTSTFIPSSGVRYNVPAGTKSFHPFSFLPKSSSPLKPETPEQASKASGTKKFAPSNQNVRHSRNFSSPVALMARQASPPKLVVQQKDAHTPTDPGTLELQIIEEQIIRAAIPTPFPSPDSQNGLTSYNDGFASRISDASNYTPSQVSRTGRSVGDGRSGYANMPVNVSRSRGSSLSSKDLPHPPSSFPSSLKENIPIPNGVRTSTSRPTRGNYSERSRKRYTILGVPSEASTTDSTPVKRRNSVDQHHEMSSASQSHHFATSNTPALPHNAVSHLRQNSRPSSQSPSRASSHSRSVSAQYPLNTDYSFHTAIHYYTTCSHTSPPSSRPLNEHPYLESYHANPALQPGTVRSVIRGSCFDCDTALRRDTETHILLRFSPEISRLKNNLTYLVDMLEEHESSYLPSTSPPRTPLGRAIGHSDKISPGKASTMTGRTIGSTSTGNTTHTNIFTDSTSVTSRSSQETAESLGRQISHLQIIISQLSTQRDNEVNTVWQGYSARWGPGTLGVVQTKQVGSMSSRAVSRAGSRSRPISMIETPQHATLSEDNYSGSGNVSRISSAQPSPQKSSFAESSVDELDEYHDPVETNQLRRSSTPAAETFYTPTGERSRSVRTGMVTPSKSVYSSFTGHQRARSRDTTPNTPFGGRSVARTETGISYSNSDTPVGRMKVNWVRGREQN